MKMKNERKPHQATRKNLTTLKKETRNDTSMTTKTKHDDEYVNKGHELAEKCGKKYNLPSTCITKRNNNAAFKGSSSGVEIYAVGRGIKFILATFAGKNNTRTASGKNYRDSKRETQEHALKNRDQSLETHSPNRGRVYDAHARGEAC